MNKHGALVLTLPTSLENEQVDKLFKGRNRVPPFQTVNERPNKGVILISPGQKGVNRKRIPFLPKPIPAVTEALQMSPTTLTEPVDGRKAGSASRAGSDPPEHAIELSALVKNSIRLCPKYDRIIGRVSVNRF